jgi:hypothetical protein
MTTSLGSYRADPWAMSVTCVIRLSGGLGLLRPEAPAKDM